jgi:metal-sulfur cluster biosynthetic enzyme
MGLLDAFRKMMSPPEPGAAPLHHLPGEPGRVLEALRLVIDPEIGLNVVDLGLVRQLSVEGDQVEVEMVLTTAGCPMADAITGEMEAVLIEAGWMPMVRVVSGQWGPDDISPAGRRWLDEGGALPG